MKWREYLNIDDLNLVHGVEVNYKGLDDEVPQHIIDADNKREEERIAKEKERKRDSWVCNDPSSPWYGQGRDTFGFKETMNSTRPRGMGW